MCCKAGVSFQEDSSLPGPTLVINNSAVVVSGGMFEGISAKQQALLVVSNSTLVLNDTIFSNNVGSIAGAAVCHV